MPEKHKKKTFQWQGVHAQFVREALGWWRADEADYAPTRLQRVLQYRYRAMLDRLRAAPISLVDWPDETFRRLRMCTGALTRHHRPQWCGRMYVCPNCYARRLWDLSVLLEQLPEGFQVLDEDWFPQEPRPSPWHSEQLQRDWEWLRRAVDRMRDKYGAGIRWSQVFPRNNAWYLRSLWIVPGDQSLAALRTQLVRRLCYPQDWFIEDLVWVGYCLRFMEGKHCRSVFGAWARKQEDS